MVITPMLMWTSIFAKKRTIQEFFIKMASVDAVTPNSEKRIKKFVNILLLVEISCILLQAFLLWTAYGKPVDRVGSSFPSYFTTIWLYYSLTSVMIVTYCSIGYFFILLLRNIKKKATYLVHKPTTEALLKIFIQYYEITDRIEEFQNAFSASSFFCIAQLCFVLSLDIMFVVAGLYTESVQIFQMVSSFLKTCVSILVITVTAAQVSSEVNGIRNTLVNAKTEFTQKMLTDEKFKDLVDLILRKDITVLSGWNILSYEKGFLLKTFAAVSAQVVLVYQVIKL
ncbi:hypothetical protein HNY73_016868 [Argiope bruennichi]|uniref:Uncharacterized protein n=1 Tax=Argiope bruennichi TaxID=94029 RepID=A0A8T0EJU5_ARGBR|nr:hypothetical protein HNY73_016868 [Argiope bruennichi]